MIYTIYGTPVKLISPIDKHGWVDIQVINEISSGWFNRTIHVSELKSNIGFEEIQLASDALLKIDNRNEGQMRGRVTELFRRLKDTESALDIEVYRLIKDNFILRSALAEISENGMHKPFPLDGFGEVSDAVTQAKYDVGEIARAALLKTKG